MVSPRLKLALKQYAKLNDSDVSKIVRKELKKLVKLKEG